MKQDNSGLGSSIFGMSPEMIQLMELVIQQQAITNVLTDVLIKSKIVGREEIEKRLLDEFKILQERIEVAVLAQEKQYKEDQEKMKQELYKKILETTEPKGEA